ncbi:hypothetical protein HPB48_022115 [Haemaphysalis longicornis]|uniref:ZSWIM3 N-terminal domain-containing protein n=1 Tax=Haemaphysalis longicornis TaxID=44386 RepID=A0A9J6GW89_HAELO|nr:hypothetical protein HPB48_022115 [Haemaphysalis longicornis]
MKLGDVFSSFEELENAVKTYSEANFVQFYKRDTRSVEAARAKGLKRHVDGQLTMYQAYYNCIKGGRAFKKRGRGERETRYVPVIKFYNCVHVHFFYQD